MKKILLSFVAAMLLISTTLTANEGMWLPMFIKRLNYVDMQKMGLQLTAEEIYSVNNSSLKDAIVSFGGFCTGEIISNKGLILTNHHCGYGSIQKHSTVENDYLANGFWAYNLDEEKPNEDLYVAFLERMEDVTNKVLADVTAEMTEEERSAAINAARKAIVEEVTKDTKFNADVKSFFGGNEFYLFIYNTFNDVRLVGAPPTSIGKYGGDTDNWMWPRHTGDFSMFRVYADKDGKPAKYSEDNVPLVPKHYLPVSIDGVEKGDFAMIMGYPGSTDRYLSSFGVERELAYHQPTVVEIRDRKLAVMREFMNADPSVNIMYASKYAQVANYWKYFIGQQEQLKRNKVKEKKEALEAEFTKWANADEKRKAKYGDALKMIEESIAEESKTEVANTYLLEAGLTGSDAILFAFRFNRIMGAAIKDPNLLPKAQAAAKDLAEKFYADYDFNLDRKLFQETMRLYGTNVAKAQQPKFFDILVNKKYRGEYDRFAEKAFESSIFTNKARTMAFIEKPNEKDLQKDVVLEVSSELIQMYFGQNAANAAFADKLEKGQRLFIAGLREMQPDKKFYPNANSTMRLTYGQVLDYSPADAVTYNYYTTLEGVMEKEDPNNFEFEIPAKLKELYSKKDYGRYANSKGELVTCFLTNNDITGGNSGSPVINGKGELIGLAFDGNWEAMSGDIEFEQNVQRTISMDIRYVMFIIDKFAGAKNLINEIAPSKANAPAALQSDVSKSAASIK